MKIIGPIAIVMFLASCGSEENASTNFSLTKLTSCISLCKQACTVNGKAREGCNVQAPDGSMCACRQK